MITLGPLDLLAAFALVLADGALSVWLGLGLARPLAVATLRTVLQLLLVGAILGRVLALDAPGVTLAVVLAMVALAAREAAARPAQRLERRGNLLVAGASVAATTSLVTLLALLTAVRPTPWYAARYAVPLAGIILGNVMNGAALALDALLTAAERERTAIEAQLALGTTFRAAMRPHAAAAIRRALLPVINAMSAAGIITLPGLMTGQIMAGMPPIEAAKYQILLMLLLSGGQGMAALAVVELATRRLTDGRDRLRLDRVGARG